MLYKSWS